MHFIYQLASNYLFQHKNKGKCWTAKASKTTGYLWDPWVKLTIANICSTSRHISQTSHLSPSQRWDLQRLQSNQQTKNSTKNVLSLESASPVNLEHYRSDLLIMSPEVYPGIHLNPESQGPHQGLVSAGPRSAPESTQRDREKRRGGRRGSGPVITHSGNLPGHKRTKKLLRENSMSTEKFRICHFLNRVHFLGLAR